MTYKITPYNSVPKHEAYEFIATGYVKVPEPSVNGGHYTGEKFATGAEYRDFPVKADAHYFNEQLSTPGASSQNVGSQRDGNNLQINSGKFVNVNGIMCKKSEDHKKEEICAFNSFSDSYGSW
jgi:hypothetical protein